MSGSVKLQVDGKEQMLNAGDFFNVMSEVAHTWCNESIATAELMIVFSLSGIDEMFREFDQLNADFVAIGNRYGMTMNG